MFDEYNEGNQIAKTAPTSADAPADGGFHTLDEDGTACSSDYYLRLTGDGGKMLKGELKLTSDRPTEPTEPTERAERAEPTEPAERAERAEPTKRRVPS